LSESGIKTLKASIGNEFWKQLVPDASDMRESVDEKIRRLSDFKK
jgi:hypothetical protein